MEAELLKDDAVNIGLVIMRDLDGVLLRFLKKSSKYYKIQSIATMHI